VVEDGLQPRQVFVMQAVAGFDARPRRARCAVPREDLADAGADRQLITVRLVALSCRAVMIKPAAASGDLLLGEDFLG